jgi:hypothetical protein
MSLSQDEYATLSERKLHVARRHLIELERELPSGQVMDPAGPEDSRAELEGHADGCVLQAYAAFDTFACAVAVRFELANPDKASFAGLVGRLSEPSSSFVATQVTAVCDAIRAVLKKKEWQDLSFYRNLAAHRGVVGQRTRFSLEEGFSFRIGDLDGPDPNGSEALPILKRLLGWAEQTLPPLLKLVGD